MGLSRPFSVFIGCAAMAGPGAAAAQSAEEIRLVSMVQPAEPADAGPIPIEFREQEGLLRNGLIAALAVREGLEVGIGRYKVNAVLRHPTHTETERQPLSVRSRDRGIAAVGLSLRF